jgi:hypothetical protein
VTVIRIDLYWQTPDAEIRLGQACLDALPPIGALISYVSQDAPDVVWRIEILYIHPAQPGSQTVVRAEAGRLGADEQVALYTAFVIPAAGPHLADPKE